MPPRAKAAPAAAAAAAAPAPDAAVVSGKRKRTTVAEVDAAAQAKAAAAAEASKPKRARAEPASKPKAAAAASGKKKRAAPAAAAASAAAASAAPRDRYPDKSIPALLGCAPALRAFCLSYPSSYEDFPWKHRVFKVGAEGSGKIFAYLHGDAGINVSLGLKLPSSGAELVRSRPGCAEEMGYGMGKHGWVGLTFNEDLGPQNDRGPVSLAQAKAWIDESYRAIANKTNIKLIDVDLN